MSLEARFRRFNAQATLAPTTSERERLNPQQFNVKEFTQNMRPYIEKFGAEACMEAFRLHHWPDGPREIDINQIDWSGAQQESQFIPKKMIPFLKLITKVEVPSDTYAYALTGPESVRERSPVWARFIDRNWHPEEIHHYEPSREYLEKSGLVSSAELDNLVADAKARPFPYGQNYSELERATYLSILEHMAADSYNQTYEVLPRNKEGKLLTPLLGKVMHTVGPQETLHKLFARTFVKAKVMEDPTRKDEVRNALSRFVMPGTFTAPELQIDGSKMSRDMDFNLGSSLRRITEQIVDMLGGYEIVDGKRIISKAGYEEIGRIGRMFLARQKLGLLRPLVEIGHIKYPVIDGKVGKAIYSRASKADQNKRGQNRPQKASE